MRATYARPMTGTIALQGGGPFVANDDLDRTLLTAAAAERVVVLPTADAFEHPERLVAESMNWAERLGVEVEALMVLRRGEAMDDGAAAVVRSSRAVYLVGDQPLHLRSVLKDTPVFDAIVAAWHDGAVLAGTAAGADVLCDPMVDTRGGAFTVGLGVIGGMAVIPRADRWSAEKVDRTVALAPADLAVVCLPESTAVLRDAQGAWRAEGAGEVTVYRGGLPVPLAEVVG